MAKHTQSRKPLGDQTCKQVTGLIADYLSDRLDPAVKRKFEQHLSICPDCVNFLNTYKKTIATTGSIRANALPLKVRRNVLAFLRKKMRQIAVVLFIFANQLVH